MKRHISASPASIDRRSNGGAAAGAASRTHTAFNESKRAQHGSDAPKPALASVRARMHTLVLEGELNHRSAHALEAEIDRLCEDGVSGITLDLRELTYIDSTGVAVIAFRCGLLERRGYDFALIPGSGAIRRAFEEARVADLLPAQEDDLATPRPPALVLAHRSRDRCERTPRAGELED